MIKLKTKEEFDNFIHDNEICCTKFGANWCGPCKVLEKTIETMEAEGFDTPIGECDIDDEEIFEIGSELGVKNLPFICFFKNGEVVDIKVGSISSKEFNNVLKSIN